MKIYGVMTGDQPDGKMIVRIDKHMDCDGYPGKGTIVINYNVFFLFFFNNNMI